MTASNDVDAASVSHALELVKRSKQKLETLRRRATMPGAITGAACRFPGECNSPAALWRLVHDRKNSARTVPSDRWDNSRWYSGGTRTPGKVISDRGGFLDHVDQFDAEFFNISAAEANFVDPQQRLLLEVAWEVARVSSWVSPTTTT